MSNVQIGRVQLLVNSIAIAEAEKATMSMPSGDEQGDGTDGAKYWSTGNGRLTITSDVMKPLRGYSVGDIAALVLNHEDVTMTWLSGQNTLSSTGRVTEYKEDFESKGGMTKGSFTFGGNEADDLNSF